MNQPSDFEFARQLSETDEPVLIDAPGLTREVIALRRRRKRQQGTQWVAAAIASAACVALLIVALPQLIQRDPGPFMATSTQPAGGDATETGADGNEFNAEIRSQSPEWEFQELKKYQRKLALLKSEVAEMRKKNDAHQLTILKENLSRNLFDEIGFDTDLTNY